MNDQIRKDIIDVLSSVIEILEVKDYSDIQEIKHLSNKVVHDITVYQDKDALSVAVIVYAFSKLMEGSPEKITYNQYIILFKGAVKALKSKSDELFKVKIRDIFKLIAQMDSLSGKYVRDVLAQAELKKSWKIYQHGLSSQTSAELFNVTHWELLQYLGNTKTYEDIPCGVDMKSRLKNARNIFS